MANSTSDTPARIVTGNGGGVELKATLIGHPPQHAVVYVKLELSNPQRSKEFVDALQRALNTWEPDKAPEWLYDVMDKLTDMPPKVRRRV